MRQAITSTGQLRVPAGLTVRSAAPTDVAGLCALHARCSPQSLYRRYLMPVRENPAAVRRLITATATTVIESSGGELVAMGNVALGESAAELALLVQDDWQRQGLGRHLAQLLAEQALAAGADALSATVLAENLAIRRTLAAAGLDPVVVGADAGTLELRCDLRAWAQRRPTAANLVVPLQPSASAGARTRPLRRTPARRVSAASASCGPAVRRWSVLLRPS